MMNETHARDEDDARMKDDAKPMTGEAQTGPESQDSELPADAGADLPDEEVGPATEHLEDTNTGQPH